jgi:hypothetical protein
MPLFRPKLLSRRKKWRPEPEYNPWARLMLRWVDRSFRLRPHQVGYYRRSPIELIDERGHTMLTASIKTLRIR